MIYQHKGMLLQNFYRRYLYILIQLPNVLDLEQRIPDFPNCDNYGCSSANNPDPMLDDTPQMTMNCIRLFVIILKLIIFEKWTSLLH